MKPYYLSLGLFCSLTIACLAQTTTNDNTLLGNNAGQALAGSSGYNNTVLGTRAGQNTTTGNSNVFVGLQAGLFTTNGTGNVFVGTGAGVNNVSGSYNTLVGLGAGTNTQSGVGNTFMGDGSGYSNQSGANNTFLGRYAGYNNTGGQANTFIGVGAGVGVGAGNLQNAVAIGANSMVSASNAIILGGTGAYAVNVGIGVTQPTYRLTVEGTIGAREVNVTTETWSDFVFEQTYKLPSLKTVERYIHAQKHLPDIPSAADVTRSGYGLGAMDAKLLRKIEELTLYAIEQQKQIDALKTLIGQLLPVKP